MVTALLMVGAASCVIDPTPFPGPGALPDPLHEPDVGLNSADDGCSSGAVTAQQYLMTFNSCPAGECGPHDHRVHLAGSDNGFEWTLLDALGDDHGGSVTDIVSYKGDLYLIHTRAGSDHMWDKLDGCLQVVEQGDVTMLGGDEGDEGWVDPSLVVDGDELVLFYLPGTPGANPAACSPGEDSCERAIRSARTDADSFPTFTVVPGDRVKVTVSQPPDGLGGFSDPDILPLADGTYLLNTSSGGNTLVYTGTELDGAFASPNVDGSPLFASKQQGGVPTAIQEASSLDVWLYVHGHTQDGGSEIRRAVSDGVTALNPPDFEAVLDRSIFGADGSASVQGVLSPSIIHWKE